MKLVKFLPLAMTAALLAACSTVSDVASSTADVVTDAGGAVVDGAKTAGGAVADGAKTVGGKVVDGAKAAGSAVAEGATAAKEAITGKKTVVYACDVSGKRNQVVSATYTFKDGAPQTATVTIAKKVVGKNMKVEATYKDGVKFVSGKNVWSLDESFDVNSVKQAVPVMFTANDRILARNCDVKK